MQRANGTYVRYLLGAQAETDLPRPVQLMAAGVVAVGLGLAMVVPMPALARPIVALAVLAAAILVQRRFAVRKSARLAGALVLDAEGVRRESSAASDAPVTRTPLLRFSEAFGVTLLANRAKDRLVLAITTRAATRYVGVRVDAPNDLSQAPAAADLLGRAATAADDDLASAQGEDGALLAPTDARALLAELATRAPGATERIYLTAPRGEPVELEGGRLKAGERAFDLGAPLEWRAFFFHESGGRVAAVYQATWVRQADAELVLVAPAAGELGYTDEPPPREQRLAIDRVFMAPLRRALERAPRASRPNFPQSRARSERRA